MKLHLGLALLLGAALSTPAPAQTLKADGETAIFVREALRICVDTGAKAKAIRGLAEAEKWTPLDTSAVPSHDRVTNGGAPVPLAGAWQVKKDGLAFTVSIYDTPDLLLFTSRCDLAARGLDLAAAHRAFASDPRFTDRSQAGWPIKQYETAGPRLDIVYAAGERSGGVLHTFSAARSIWNKD